MEDSLARFNLLVESTIASALAFDQCVVNVRYIIKILQELAESNTCNHIELMTNDPRLDNTRINYCYNLKMFQNCKDLMKVLKVNLITLNQMQKLQHGRMKMYKPGPVEEIKRNNIKIRENVTVCPQNFKDIVAPITTEQVFSDYYEIHFAYPELTFPGKKQLILRNI